MIFINWVSLECVWKSSTFQHGFNWGCVKLGGGILGGYIWLKTSLTSNDDDIQLAKRAIIKYPYPIPLQKKTVLVVIILIEPGSIIPYHYQPINNAISNVSDLPFIFATCSLLGPGQGLPRHFQGHVFAIFGLPGGCLCSARIAATVRCWLPVTVCEPLTIFFEWVNYLHGHFSSSQTVK